MGTVGYRWGQGYAEANMLEFNIELQVYVVGDDFMADEAIAGDEKARRLKERFGIAAGANLMEELG